MIEVHKEMHRVEQAQEVQVVKMPHTGLPVYRRKPLTRHPVQLAAENIANSRCQRLLCLDEMQVTDIADAMILRKLFASLVSQGVCVVFTSNVPPEGLYSDPYLARSREYFLPFISLLYSTCCVQMVGQRGQDYRTLPSPSPDVAQEYSHLVKNTPSGGFFTDEDALEKAWQHVTAGTEERPLQLAVEFNRQLSVPRTATSRTCRAAWFNFLQLCSKLADGNALGAADFLALSSEFEEVFMAGLCPLE